MMEKIDWNNIFYRDFMIVSRCCDESVFVEQDYYVCDKCGRPCHTKFSLNLTKEGSEDDSRNESEIEKFIVTA